MGADEQWIRLQGLAQRGRFGDHQATFHARAAACGVQGDVAGQQRNLTTADKMTGATDDGGRVRRGQGLPAAEQ